MDTNIATTPLNRKPSLASRIVLAENDPRLKDAARVDDAKSPASASVNTKTPLSAKHTSPILQFAESIGIYIDAHVGRVIHAMWLQVYHDGEVKPFGTRIMNLDHYYGNLITLYILLFRQGSLNMAYIVLLRFQNTNFNKTGSLPGIELALQAFQFLPAESPLCQWLAIMYAFLWNTQNEGDWHQFVHTRPGLNAVALNKLLFAVSYIRDPFTEGHDSAVLVRWCAVHDHTEGSQEQELCDASREGLKLDLRQATRNEKVRMLAQAQERITDYGDTATLDDPSDLQGQSSPVHTGKRKFESSPPARPYQKRKRGVGYRAGR